MSNREFTATRTMLANAFATAGAELLGYQPLVDTAVAAISETKPQKYAIAGTLPGILQMAGKMMGEDVSAAEKPTGDLTDEQIDAIGKKYAGLGGIEDYRSFARDVARAAIAAHLARQAQQAESTLTKICDMFLIGARARDEGTILANVTNVLRRERCLSAVEREFFMVAAEPDKDFPDEDPGEDCMLNWGLEPAKYVEQFRVALAQKFPVHASQEGAHAAQWISVDERLPENTCLAVYMPHFRGHKPRVIRAVYFKQYQVEASGDDGQSTQYNEADDTDYVKAGWYERIDNWGDFSSVNVCEGVVTHWMPLPPAPGLKTPACAERSGDHE